MDRRDHLGHALDEAIALHAQVRAADPTPVLRAADAVVHSLARGGKVLLFGNGGSAADAQHVAAEFVGRFLLERRPLPAIALTTDTSLLTAVANDVSFAHVFVRQVEALGRAGDVAIGISTSGDSPNVVAGVEAARRGGLVTVGFTGGDGGSVGRAVDIHVNVPSSSTPRIQELHILLLHVMCDIVERELCHDAPGAAKERG